MVTARDLTPEQLEAAAHGLGIHTWADYDELVDLVDNWCLEAKPPRQRRSIRQVTGEAMAIAVVVAWLGVTGALVGAMAVAKKLEGRP